MLRHACGYYLANQGIDTRSIQAFLGHKNITHTVRYTELSHAERFHQCLAELDSELGHPFLSFPAGSCVDWVSQPPGCPIGRFSHTGNRSVDPEASQPRSWGTRESARTSGSTNQNLVRGPCKYAQDRSERISPIRFQRLYP